MRSRLSELPQSSEPRTAIENEISEYLSSRTGTAINPHNVIVIVYGFKSVKEQSRNNEGSIIIIEGSRKTRFEETSTLFRSIDERQNEQFITVYAPIEFSSDLEKNRKRSEFEREIPEIIEKVIGKDI